MKKVLKLLHSRIDELEGMLSAIEIMLQEDIDKPIREKMIDEIQKLLSK